jgi:CubicO group peptidase (beta-lactamase class C family)
MPGTTPDWLDAAVAYIPRWLDFQRVLLDQPGVALAVAWNGKVVLEHASGVADLATGETLTSRHRFRVASHSKTFTAAGILRLREQGRLGLDDPLNRHLRGLTDEVGGVTLAQLLSHSGGLTRDGEDGGQFSDRRPFLSEAEFRADLAKPQPLPAGSAFKYSNHGFALLGKVIEAVTGETYARWIGREVVEAAGLGETSADYGAQCHPFARGHSTREPLGRRLVIPGDHVTGDMASATGFVSTAADLARFYGSLLPSAGASCLSAASRREMTRRHWRDAHSALERYYGLGTISSAPGPWSWVGHAGGYPGTLSRTVALPEQGLALSVLTNAIDGMANVWFEGVINCLKTFQEIGAPSPATEAWSGRWWSAWTAVDLVPGRSKVLVALPAQTFPFFDASELSIAGADHGRVVRAQAFGDLGEACVLHRNEAGGVRQVQIGGKLFVSEPAIKAELLSRYGGASRAPGA